MPNAKRLVRMQGRDPEAHRSGISIHRIAQIFRERDVDISTQHLMRAIRLFIAEGRGERERGLCYAGEAAGTTCRWRREADFGYLPGI